MEPQRIRIEIPPADHPQWRRDISRIRLVLGRVPYATLILMAVHVFAARIDQLDPAALAALVNGTTKEKDE